MIHGWNFDMAIRPFLGSIRSRNNRPFPLLLIPTLCRDCLRTRPSWRSSTDSLRSTEPYRLNMPLHGRGLLWIYQNDADRYRSKVKPKIQQTEFDMMDFFGLFSLRTGYILHLPRIFQVSKSIQQTGFDMMGKNTDFLFLDFFGFFGLWAGHILHLPKIYQVRNGRRCWGPITLATKLLGFEKQVFGYMCSTSWNEEPKV